MSDPTLYDRIPAAACLDLDQPIDIREDHGRIVIEPVRPRRYELAEFLAGITPENIHGEVDTGPPQGREFW